MSKHTPLAPLDPLTALVMVSNADDTDLVIISLGQPSHCRRRHYCMRHLVEKEHRLSHLGDAIKYPPEVICKMIARDNIIDRVRRAFWVLFAVERRTDTNWMRCVHCRVEAKKEVLRRA